MAVLQSAVVPTAVPTTKARVLPESLECPMKIKWALHPATRQIALRVKVRELPEEKSMALIEAQRRELEELLIRAFQVNFRTMQRLSLWLKAVLPRSRTRQFRALIAQQRMLSPLALPKSLLARHQPKLGLSQKLTSMASLSLRKPGQSALQR